MNKLYKYLSKKVNVASTLFVIVLALTVFLLFIQFALDQNRIVGDTATHLLLAISPLVNAGSPYRDIWEIKPPVWPIIMYSWSAMFGFGIMSIRVVYVLTAGVIIFFTRTIFKKVFSTPIFEILFVCSIVTVLSPILNSIMLSTEIVGLAISLTGLYFLLSDKNRFSKYYLSGFLFLAASQTKEPFTFAIIAVVPVFVWSLIQKGLKMTLGNIFIFLLGIVSSLSIIYFYLYRFGSVSGYMEVFRFKQLFFTYEKLIGNFLPGYHVAARTFIEYPSAFEIFLLIAIGVSYLVNRYSAKLHFDKIKSELVMASSNILNDSMAKRYTVLFYSIGSFIGFGVGGSFGSHYLIQVVIPFYMILGLVLTSIFDNLFWLVGKSKLYIILLIIVGGLVISMSLPKRPYVSSLLHRDLRFEKTDQIFNYEKRVTQLTTQDKCILSVYGWGVSENYIYTNRRPCTRFVLANMVSQNWQYAEYSKAIYLSPPSAIIYQTKGADMNIERFESEVVNIKKIIKNCYSPDSIETVVFTPKFKDEQKLKDCILVNSH